MLRAGRRLTRRAFLERSAKASAAVGAGLVFGSLLEACATGTGGGTRPTPPAGSSVIRALLFDQVGYDPSVLQKLADRFAELHQGKAFVSIETAHYRDLYESILAAGLSRPAPYDVVALDQVWVPEFASRKQLLSLTDQLPDDVRADLMPSILDAFSFNNTLWGMPHVLNVQSLYYNKDQLRIAGYSEPPATLEDWYEQMTRLKARQTPVADSWAEGEGLVSDFVRITAEFGGSLFDDSGKPLLGSQPVARAAAFMRQLIDEHLVRPEVGAANEPDAMRSFLSGAVTFTPNWNFVFGAMADPVYSQIIGQAAVAPMPASGSAHSPAATVSSFLGLGVLSATRSPDLALSFVRYMTSPEVQAQQLGQLPIWTSLQNSSNFRRANPQMDIFLENLQNARPRPKLTHYVEASAVLQHHLHDLVIGAASPQKAMADAQKELLSLEARWK